MATGDPGPAPVGRSASPASRRGPASGTLLEVHTEWAGFYSDHYHRVVRFIMTRGEASLAGAEDAAQEAFTESWLLISHDPDAWQAIGNKGAWVRAVACRRQSRPPGTRHRPLVTGCPVPDLPAPGPGHAELTDQLQAVLQALRGLDDESRAVMAFTLDDFTTADIAAVLGISRQRVRDVLKKARAALRRQLAEIIAAEGRQP
jgi:DNA-directed RNA polymerase specialized sigma24 family protein